MDTPVTNDGTRPSLTTLFETVTSHRRRRTLAVLLDHRRLAAPDLATRVAAAEQGVATSDVSADERDAVHRDLHHVHLPKLTAAGLVRRDSDEGTIAATDHPAFEDPGIRDALDGSSPVEPQSHDALFAALADARRRIVLDVLSHQYQSIQVETLARDVAAREGDAISPADVSPETIETVVITLRHVHLPKLADSGLIRYDADEGTVAYEGHPDLRVPWMHSALGPEFRSELTEDPGGTTVGSIESRESIVSYGQSLCDDADEELFMLFTTTGLLEAGCFSRIRQAVNRGVDVYLGTCDPTVQEFVRERAPEITIWEPETNWLDLPVGEDNVGRLVLADREAVMIGTLGERADDGVHAEQAIVGEGANNALVVTIRQLLQSRLDELDASDELETAALF